MTGIRNRGRQFMIIAAVLLACGVALGAFAAHGLKPRVSPERFATFQTAVDYHIWHALGLLLLGNIAGTLRRSLVIPAGLLVLGVLLFSGSLYLLVLTDIRELGMITPLGGLAFITGWTWLAVVLWQESSERRS